LRDLLNAGFAAVTAQADAVLFEFGPSRQRKLQIRDDIQRWQPSIRTLLQVQIAAVQYLTLKPLSSLPEHIAQAGVEFEKEIAQVMHAMASVVSGKPVGDGVPDIRMSAARLRQEIEEHFSALGVAIPDQASDLAGLADSLATILAPLYEDIRATYAVQNQALEGEVRLQHGHA
jgi:multidrug resistance protein MdtO